MSSFTLRGHLLVTTPIIVGFHGFPKMSLRESNVRVSIRRRQRVVSVDPAASHAPKSDPKPCSLCEEECEGSVRPSITKPL